MSRSAQSRALTAELAKPSYFAVSRCDTALASDLQGAIATIQRSTIIVAAFT